MQKISVFAFLISIIFLISCNGKMDSTTEIKTVVDTVETIDVISSSSPDSNGLDFSEYKIQKGSLGAIKTGMTLKEVDSILIKFNKRECISNDLGFDGGGAAYVYSYDSSAIIGIVPGLNTDTVICIIAFHEKLKTTNGLHPNITVEDLLRIYPTLMIHQDHLNEWEYAEDLVNKWDFIFYTKSTHLVGEYTDTEKPSKPRRLDIHCDWINIR